MRRLQRDGQNRPVDLVGTIEFGQKQGIGKISCRQRVVFLVRFSSFTTREISLKTIRDCSILSKWLRGLAEELLNIIRSPSAGLAGDVSLERRSTHGSSILGKACPRQKAAAPSG
jgi:hypothetical protein